MVSKKEKKSSLFLPKKKKNNYARNGFSFLFSNHKYLIKIMSLLYNFRCECEWNGGLYIHKILDFYLPPKKKKKIDEIVK